MIFDVAASLDSQGQAALTGALRSGMPSNAIAAYARWFQIETWLRTLVHLELSAAYGRSWIAHLTGKVENRRSNNAVNAYMLSPDEESLLAYGDVSDLFAIIESNWMLFEPVLVKKVRWDGWADELRGIRNRIGHCRRPHADDVFRLEQILRNLEPGAKRGLAAYERFLDIAEDDPRIPPEWRADSAKWTHIANHARGQYKTNFRVDFSKRPWAKVEDALVGVAGTLVHARWRIREGYVLPQVVWPDLQDQGFDPSLIVHYVQDDCSNVDIVFSGMDDVHDVARAIEYSFQAVLGNIERYRDDDNFMHWAESAGSLDPRCHIDDAFAHADRLRLFSVFGAERSFAENNAIG